MARNAANLTNTTFLIGLLLVPSVALLSLLALLVEGLYPGLGAAETAGTKGMDLVSLAFVTPVMLGSLIQAYNGRLRGYLLLLGCLGYVFYVFGAYALLLPFSTLFYPHIALFSLALFGLILGLMHLNPTELQRRVELSPLLHRVLGLELLLFGLVLIFLWLGGTLIAPLLDPVAGEKTAQEFVALRVYQVLDLGIVLPGFVLAGLLLLQRKPWAMR